MFTSRPRNWKNVFDVAASLVMIVATITLVVMAVNRDRPARPSLQAPDAPISVADAATKGSAKAEKVLVVFSDFQCPYCRRFAREILPELERKYVAAGKLDLAFRHLPLPIHPHAIRAAASADCAGAQGRFWEMHDLLFADGVTPDEVGVRAAASKVGLDISRFDQCLQDPKVTDNITSKARAFSSLGLRATPSFFLGTRLPNGMVDVVGTFSGTPPLADFVKILDTELDDRGWFRLFRRLALAIN